MEAPVFCWGPIRTVSSARSAAVLLWLLCPGRCAPLTENGPGWHRFPVQPEGHLGQDDCHDAGQVGLYDEVANLPLQVELSRHDSVLAWERAEAKVRRSF